MGRVPCELAGVWDPFPQAFFLCMRWGCCVLVFPWRYNICRPALGCVEGKAKSLSVCGGDTGREGRQEREW